MLKWWYKWALIAGFVIGYPVFELLKAIRSGG